MLYQTRLDVNVRAQNVSVGFMPELLTIINPTPFILRAHMSGDLSSVGDFIVQAGTTMSIPTRARQWSFELVVTGGEPEDFAPALIYFTQDEIAPSVLAIGVADVTYKQVVDAIKTSTDNVYYVSTTSWVALDDNVFKLTVVAETGKVLVNFAADIKLNSDATLFLGVYDSITLTTVEFARARYVTGEVDRFMSGYADLGEGGERDLYLRGRIRNVGDAEIRKLARTGHLIFSVHGF